MEGDNWVPYQAARHCLCSFLAKVSWDEFASEHPRGRAQHGPNAFLGRLASLGESQGGLQRQEGVSWGRSHHGDPHECTAMVSGGIPHRLVLFFLFVSLPVFFTFLPEPAPPADCEPKRQGHLCRLPEPCWARIRHSTTKRFFQGKKLKFRKARDRPGKGWH